MHILALDVGTSSVKAAVLDVARAAPVGPVAHIPYALDHPCPEAAEVPAERLWNAVASAAREATRRAPDVQAVGLSVMTPALVLLDSAEKPLRPIWTHLDRRARPAARQVWAAVGEEFLASVGNRPLPGGISAVCWRQLLADDPYLKHDVRSYLHVNGWLGLRMTGERAFDAGNASFTGLFNTMTDQHWSERWCEFFEVERTWLPPVVDGKATLGHVRAAAASELGVPAGVPLKLGLADTSSAVLAAGMEPGDLLHIVGTTQVLAMLTDRPVADARRLTRCHGTGALFLQVAHNPVGGVALEWLHGLCFHEQSAEEFFHKTIPLARERKTRVTLDPPYLGGDRLEIEAHRAAFRDLTLTTDRLDLLAATLEALVRRHREALQTVGISGSPRRLFLTGGAAEIVHGLIPEYAGAAVHMLDEGSLRGVAGLFAGSV
ncbi:MAG: FGGY-family carbohydrate kinase [Gemmataceae bacterium]|nr:FGGY-family carbohydrate kinase [Gemmataceae bacterium]